VTEERVPLPPAELLQTLTARLTGTLREDLLSLTVHGSYASGDYHPGRSDVDLLAVLATDPDEARLAQLTPVHDDLVRDHPEWTDHVEVDYVAPAAVAAVLRAGPTHPMMRICPGEPLHLTEATSHYLLNWRSAQDQGLVLAGAPAGEVLAPIDAAQIAAVVRSHLSQWPSWIEGMHRPGEQAYAVLTVCRAGAALNAGRQVSKRAAAVYGLSRLPRWTSLIEWARDWWYAGGRDDDPSRLDEVTIFVAEVSAAMLDDRDVRRT
jgi:hypothetical protein